MRRPGEERKERARNEIEKRKGGVRRGIVGRRGKTCMQGVTLVGHFFHGCWYARLTVPLSLSW